MVRLSTVLTLFLACVRPALLPAQPVYPDLILHNALVLTMEDALPQTSAVAVSGDTILAVGTDAAVLSLAGPTTRLLELQGLTVVPGFEMPTVTGSPISGF